MSEHSGWLSPFGEFIERGDDHFSSLPRQRNGSAPSPRVDSTREGTLRGYSRLKHLGDQINVDCLAEKMELVETWVLQHTGVKRIPFHVWSSEGNPVSYHEVELSRGVAKAIPTDIRRDTT